MKTNKKAISPIITTVLLVLVAMILAMIILVWARGFISEKISKFVPAQTQDRPVDEACQAVSLSVAVSGNNELAIINQGDIPVYKIGVRVKDSSSGEATIEEKSTEGLDPGQSISIATEKSLIGNSVSVVPILIAKSEKKGTVEYNCKNYQEVSQ